MIVPMLVVLSLLAAILNTYSKVVFINNTFI